MKNTIPGRQWRCTEKSSGFIFIILLHEYIFIYINIFFKNTNLILIHYMYSDSPPENNPLASSMNVCTQCTVRLARSHSIHPGVNSTAHSVTVHVCTMFQYL